ncbi:DUF1660 family phage protein [Lactococcus lactis]|uniref:DUF1660 family phage protein n=1 Tax=Lactococcus lactis TaxID=1358 RepID=UPI000519B19D|nr:DUF1660 family phage protein [Lactococcus lactis]OJH47566.1 hypothetical protein LGL2_04950 [Lactococcus lactis subsp. lactis bv. diacetylactis]
MIEPLKYRILRKLKQLFCFNHDWYIWVNKKDRTCLKCDKTEKDFNRSDLDESENVFPEKWLDKHMD